jgi:hypothetical protein
MEDGHILAQKAMDGLEAFFWDHCNGRQWMTSKCKSLYFDRQGHMNNQYDTVFFGVRDSVS